MIDIGIGIIIIIIIILFIIVIIKKVDLCVQEKVKKVVALRRWVWWDAAQLCFRIMMVT